MRGCRKLEMQRDQMFKPPIDIYLLLTKNAPCHPPPLQLHNPSVRARVRSPHEIVTPRLADKITQNHGILPSEKQGFTELKPRSSEPKRGKSMRAHNLIRIFEKWNDQAIWKPSHARHLPVYAMSCLFVGMNRFSTTALQ